MINFMQIVLKIIKRKLNKKMKIIINNIRYQKIYINNS